MAALKKTDKAMPVLVFIISFIVFYMTKISTTYWWDSGLFISASKTLGIPNAPGAAVFLLLGRVFSMIPISQEIAVRIQIPVIILSALTVSFVYLIIAEITRKLISNISL